MPKSGFNTTEFWLVLPVVIASIYGSLQGLLPQPYGMLIAAGAGGLYAAFRSWLKVAHAQGKLQEIPDLPDAPAIPIATPKLGGVK